MAVYSSIDVQGTEFISLTGDPLPSCLNDTEPHVVGSGLIMRPAVVKKQGKLFYVLAHSKVESKWKNQFAAGRKFLKVCMSGLNHNTYLKKDQKKRLVLKHSAIFMHAVTVE